MADAALTYRLPGAAWCLAFPPAAVEHLHAHAQRRCWSKERVGQLYSADLTSSTVRIDAITTLGSRWSSHNAIHLNMLAVLAERKKMFAAGLHCLGFWHSHPQTIPVPSQDDIAMAADHAQAASAVFAGLVFVIIGTAPAPDGLGVWVHDGARLLRAVQSAEPPLLAAP
jgi:hypothetical protein